MNRCSLRVVAWTALGWATWTGWPVAFAPAAVPNSSQSTTLPGSVSSSAAPGAVPSSAVPGEVPSSAGAGTPSAAGFTNRALPAGGEKQSILLEHCLVTLIDDIQVPALRTGRITKLQAREGLQVKEGELLAQIDDAEATLQLKAAVAAKDAAHKKANSALEEVFAEASQEVAVAEHEAALKANEKLENSVSDIEVVKLQAAVKQAAVRVELGQFNRAVQIVELGATDAKAALAETDVAQRKLTAPLAGEIAEIFVRPGEWVEAGAEVLRLVRVDQLRVEGYVKVRDVLPKQVLGKKVTVTIELAEGQRSEFQGTVTFVSPLIEAGNQYRIWAEVTNRQDSGHWMLRPGMQAEMTIAR